MQKTKVFASLVVIVLTVTLIGVATIAYFSSSAKSDEVTFQAGTLMIEADTSVLYGVEWQEGKENIYEILLSSDGSFSTNWLFKSDLATDLNGLAFDKDNLRLYYTSSSADGDLFFYELEGVETGAGTLGHQVWGATFGMGYYWFIPNETTDLYRVGFKADGTIDDDGPELYDGNIAQGKSFTFGDIALDMKDGIIYGSTSPLLEGDQEFFTYNIYTNEYNEVNTDTTEGAVNLQIAFGNNGLLYGHHTSSKEWYIIDTMDGKKGELLSVGDIQFSDLASGYVSNWNPGDCDMARFFVRSTGTKNSNVRFSVSGAWEDGLDASVVTISLCGDNPNENDDWVKKEDHFYFKGILAPGEQVEICLMVCLDGEGTDDDFQGMTFNLTPIFEAIQESNDAAKDEWGYYWDSAGNEWIKTEQVQD